MTFVGICFTLDGKRHYRSKKKSLSVLVSNVSELYEQLGPPIGGPAWAPKIATERGALRGRVLLSFFKRARELAAT